MMWKSENGSRQTQNNESKESKGLMQLGRESPKNSVKAHGNVKLRKGPRKRKKSKWTKDAQEKTNGTQEPANDVRKEPMAVVGHWKKNKRQAQRGSA